ncbi:MAG: SMC family ATPase [Clostridia bacterium]|nr:SMC family ATPase [Clostridia bacterium]
MKPIKLEFEGINSFSEHTIIDFEALTKNGIFGIFGDTGSGKSTILDCINFALYGNVERSKIMTDIINYRSESAKVKFVFNILNEGKRKTYTVDRTIKKDKYGTHKASLYERDGDTEVCIADKANAVEKKIVEILGVEAEDFRKCIALPQGEFAQFVKSAPRERLALIERLFSLSKYGEALKEKLRVRQEETDGIYNNLAGRLQAYEEITENALNQAYMGVNSKKTQLEELNKKAKELTEKCEKLKVLNEKRIELEETEKKLTELEHKKAEIEELRQGLKSLASCREVVKVNGEICAKLNDIRGAIAKINEFKAQIAENLREIEILEKNGKDGDFDNNITECVRLQALYVLHLSDTEKLNALSNRLIEKRKEYRKKEEEKFCLEQDKKSAEKELKTAEQELLSCTGNGVEEIVNIQFKGAVLKEEYAYNLDYFANLKSGVKVFKENSPLYNYVIGELEGKIKEYSERVRDVKDFSLDNVNEQLERLQRLDKEREVKQKTLNSINDKLQRLNAAIEIKNSELKSLLKDGAEIKAQTDELNAELKKVFGENCNDFKAVIKYNDDKLNSLKRQKEEFTEKTERAKNKKTELSIMLERATTTKSAWEEETAKFNKKLEELVKTSGLESVESCVALAAKFDKMPDAEATLKEFDTALSLSYSKAEELKKINGIFSVTNEEFEAVNCEKSNICGGVSTLTGEIAVLENECENLKARLKEKEEILKEFAKIENERNLIARLKETTKNNKFMEFIANEYLYDISRLASNTLLKLKDGRYFLTYKDNNFFVGDNFDCGNLRGVNTLSGGETFLVSLSLALALSQTICARSLKNIEFFFLDEGFGTLDNSLVDTVMNALEKLKSSNFTIGVISHVEELKHRIDSKITVNKATESCGSTVTVNC